MFKLDNLTDFIEKYVKITTEIAEVDAEVVDYKLRRISGSGRYFKGLDLGEQTSNRKIIMDTLKSGKAQILEMTYYKNSEAIDVVEVTIPLKLNGNIIGVICLSSNDIKTKEEVKNNLSKYIGLLEQISEFIILKCSEYEEDIDKQAMVSMLEIIIRNMDEGAVIINNEGKINTINRSAKKQLGINKIIANEDIIIEPTGDTVNNSKEYNIKIHDNYNTVMGDIFKIPENPIFDKVLLFKDMKQVRSNIYAMTTIIDENKITNIVGSSKKTMEIKNNILKISKSDSTILIAGETGTGKEVYAMSIWKNSNRANNRFVTINCGSISEIALEIEMFGYVKGAFSGDNTNGKLGKFELANNGVIFLNEVDNIPLYLQTKLLRVLHDKKVRRIGSNQIIPINVRVIASTNKDLKQLIYENKFREDLFYKLNVIPLFIPALRDRKDDVEDLSIHFLEHYSKQFGKSFNGIEDDALELLYSYNWPGNIRELENVMEYIVNIMEDGFVKKEFLPKNILNFYNSPEGITITPLAKLEKIEIEKALNKYGNTTEGKKMAAKSLGIGIATLYRKI